MDENKRIATNAFMLYLRMFVILGVTLYTSRVVISTLGEVDYGLYNVVGGVVVMFSFLNASMSSATTRFLTTALGRGNKGELSKLFSSSILVHFAIAIIILILAESLGVWFLENKLVIPPDRLNAARWVFQCSVISALILVINVPYSAVIIAYEKMDFYAYISLFEVGLKLAIVFLLSVVQYDKLIVYGVLIVLVQVIVYLAHRAYCNKQFPISKYKYCFDKGVLREILNFAGWSLLGNLSVVGYTQGLNILLNIFFGPAINAARAISVQVQTAVVSFVVNFQKAINPQITKSYAKTDLVRMHSLLFASSKYSFLLILILTMPIIVNIDLILHVWLTEVPEFTASFVVITLVISMVDALANPMIIAAHATGRIRNYQLIIGALLLSILPISYLVLKVYQEPIVVFLVQLAIVFLSYIARVVMLVRMVEFPVKKYIYQVVLRCILVALFASLAYTIVKSATFALTGLVLFIIKSSIVTLITLSSAIIFGVSKEEKNMVIKKIRGKLDTFLYKKAVIKSRKKSAKSFLKVDESFSYSELYNKILDRVMKIESDFVILDESWAMIRNLHSNCVKVALGNSTITNEAAFDNHLIRSDYKSFVWTLNNLKSPRRKENWVYMFSQNKLDDSFVIKFKTKISTFFEEYQIAFRFNDIFNRYRFRVVDNKRLVFETIINGIFVNEMISVPFSFDIDVYYDIELIVYGQYFIFSVDGKPVLTVNEINKLIDGGSFAFIFWNQQDDADIDLYLSDVRIYKIK